MHKNKAILQNNLLLVFITAVLSLVLVSITALPVHAEVEKNAFLAVTNYDTTQDFDILLGNSTRVLAYYSGQEVDRPVMLHIVSKDQQEAIIKKDYNLKVIKRDPDMTKYRLFYLVDPREIGQLKQLGTVHQIARSYALVGLTDGKTIAPGTHRSRILPEPFLNLVLSTNPNHPIQPSLPPNSELTQPKRDPLMVGAIAMGLILLVLAAVGGGYFIYRRRKQSSVDEGESSMDTKFEQPPLEQNTESTKKDLPR